MAETDQLALPAFEGRKVTTAAVKVTHAGDGLSAALEVEPKALGLADEVAYVLTGTVISVGHTTKDGKVIRVHTVKADDIAEIDLEVAVGMIEEAHNRIERIRDEKSGQQRMEDELPAEELPTHNVAPDGTVVTPADAFDPFGESSSPEAPDPESTGETLPYPHMDMTAEDAANLDAAITQPLSLAVTQGDVLQAIADRKLDAQVVARQVSGGRKSEVKQLTQSEMRDAISLIESGKGDDLMPELGHVG